MDTVSFCIKCIVYKRTDEARYKDIHIINLLHEPAFFFVEIRYVHVFLKKGKELKMQESDAST